MKCEATQHYTTLSGLGLVLAPAHVDSRIAVVVDIRRMDKHLILWMWLVSMDKLRVYLMKAGKTFEGSTAEICTQIGQQINLDLMKLSKEKRNQTVDK
jgi:hypothetical protein